MSIINVKWGKERIRLQFPDDPAATPLGVIRQRLADHTGLAPDRFKLINSGAIMKDDSLPLTAYRLKPGSTIALMGTGEDVDVDRPSAGSGAKKQPTGPATEQSTLQSINAELDAVRNSLKPSVNTFLTSISAPSPSTASSPHATTAPAPPASVPPPTPSFDDAKTTHARLGELLLQSLLRLDAIMPESEWTEARTARKSAVKEVQALLDQLDSAWRGASTTLS